MQYPRRHIRRGPIWVIVLLLTAGSAPLNLGAGRLALDTEHVDLWQRPKPSVAPTVGPRMLNTAPRRSRGSDHEVFVNTQHGPFDDLIAKAAERYSVNPFLLKGLLANESKLDPVRFGKRSYAKTADGKRILISGGAMGIAQFTGGGIRAVNALRRARRRRGEKVLYFYHPFVPEAAIPAAAELLAHLIRRYGRDGGITAYNSGIAGGLAVKRHGFWKARSRGTLQRYGVYLLQGHRFLLNVLSFANRFRRDAGLAPLPGPDADRPDSLRYAKAALRRTL